VSISSDLLARFYGGTLDEAWGEEISMTNHVVEEGPDARDEAAALGAHEDPGGALDPKPGSLFGNPPGPPLIQDGELRAKTLGEGDHVSLTGTQLLGQ
jgi:hypothetical protein